MALFVGGQFIPDTAKEAKTIVAVKGFDRGVYIGPLISSQAKERVERIITEAVEKDGVTLELNLWGNDMEGYPKG